MRKLRDESEESESQDDDNSHDEQKIEIRKPKIDRIDKFKNLKKIVINVSNSVTEYPVVTEVAQQLEWKIQTNNQAGDWDIYWTDFSIDPDVLIKMHLFQKINHFPGIQMIARKNLLAENLSNMSKKFPTQYNFFPMTWLLPQQYAQFRLFYENKQKGKTRTYIVKPQAQCQGRGIFLTRKIQDMQTGKHYVVQRYIARPYLLDGLKFDFRIYVLMCGTDPLKLYMYNEGLARLATQQYHQPMNANLDRLCMHLTNYAINKYNPNFIFNNSVHNMGVGHKRALTCVFKQLAQRGLNMDVVKAKIKDIIIKTIISGLPLMAHQYKFSQPQDYTGNMCFHILGLDVMLNSKGQPIVLEVNHTPSFTTDTPLDHKIKYNLIKDTLILMNVNIKQKNQLLTKCKQYNTQRLITGKRHIYEGQDRQQKIKQAQEFRQKYEREHLGGFEKIYPLDNEEDNAKYEEMIKVSMEVYISENHSIKSKLKEIKKFMRSQFKNIRIKSKEKEKEIEKEKEKEKEKDHIYRLQKKMDQQFAGVDESMEEKQTEHEKKNQQNIFESQNNSPRDIQLTLSQPAPATVQQQQISQRNSQIIHAINCTKQFKRINDQLASDVAMVKINRINKIIVKESPYTLIAERKNKQINKMQQCQSKLIRRQLYISQKNKKLAYGSQARMSENKNNQLPTQLPNIDSIGVNHGYTQLIQQQSNANKKRQKVFSYQIKPSIKSEPKNEKLTSSKQKQIKNNKYKKLFSINHGQYVMPKIFLINVDEKKQKQKDKDKDKNQIPLFSLVKKIQMSALSNNG